MNPEIITLIKAKIQDKSFLCKHSLIFSFLLTCGVLFLRNGLSFNHPLDMMFPTILFLIIYVIINNLAYCTTSVYIIKKLYNDVLNVRQSYNDLVNDELFESIKNIDVLKKKVKKTTVEVQKLKKITKDDNKEKEEFSLINKLDDTFATSDFTDNNIGCLLAKTSICSGQPKPENIVAPVPGPQWQVQTAATVAARISSGNYVPSNCLM
tara:strand:+ start:94 stop:720 length:627 start_codon:yes stop_codon:yes gene_type:complete